MRDVGRSKVAPLSCRSGAGLQISVQTTGADRFLDKRPKFRRELRLLVPAYMWLK